MEILGRAITFLCELKRYLNNLVHFFASVKNLVSVTMRDEADRLIQIVKDEYAITDGKPTQKASGITLDAWTRQVGVLALPLIHLPFTNCVDHLQSRPFYCQNQPSCRKHQRCKLFIYTMVRTRKLIVRPIA